MATELTWLGHGSWSIQTANKDSGHRVLLDPFLDQSPTAPCKAADIEADYILVSHGHFDHIADVPAIAQRTGAEVAAAFEVCQWLRDKHSIEKTIDLNLGGGCDLPFGRVVMTIAWHSSQLPDGSYGGNPGGFLLSLPEGKVYFACDTALFSDMKLIGAGGLELAVLPIGDKYTMGPDDSIEAIKLLQPRLAAPAHYNTWPPIAQDAQKWAARVESETSAKPIVIEPGGKIVLGVS